MGWQNVFLLIFICLQGKDSLAGTQLCPKGCFEHRDYDAGVTACNCCHRDNGTYNPCTATSCPKSTDCIVTEIPCRNPFGLPCRALDLEGACYKPCPLPKKCNRGCVHVVDETGCMKCYCDRSFKNPCKPIYTGCNHDEECVLIEPPCTPNEKDCSPFATCQKKCEPVKYCPKGCVKYIDTENCETCHCCNRCVAHRCPKGQKCVLVDNPCIRAPCIPLPSCVKE